MGNINTGIVALGNDFKFYCMANVKNIQWKILNDLDGLTSVPTSWTVVTLDREILLIVIQDTAINVISSIQKEWVKKKVEFAESLSSITEIAVSVNQQHITLLSDQGALWLGSSDFQKKYCEFNTKCKSRPKQLLWCGNGAVVGYWDNLLLVVGPEKDWLNYILDSPSYLVAEIDGIRIVGSETHEIFQKVPSVVADIFKIAFIAPGAWLLEASREFRKKSHKADEFLRMIKEKDQLELAVSQCIQAAGHEFLPATQKMLLRAGSFGKCFSPDLNPTLFVEVCKKLRVLNAMRVHTIGIPLTYTQLEHLTIPVLINRLVLRRHYCLAIQICQYLKIPEKEGSSQVLFKWAIYKVNQPSVEPQLLAKEIADKLGNAPGISYSDVAAGAIDKGHRELGINLLDYEIQASKQVPLLSKLKQHNQAIYKAIESGDTDLVYYVIFNLEDNKHDTNIFSTIRNVDTALNLYIKFLRQTNLTNLCTVYYQKDNHPGQAYCHIIESYETLRIERRLSCLKEAIKAFKDGKLDFFQSQIEDQVTLLQQQISLENQFPNEKYVNLSVHDTISKLIGDKNNKQAEQMRKDFRVPDRRYWWLKITVLVNNNDWAELDKFSKSKKSPIGYEPFVDLCLKHKKRIEARKYVSRVKEENKIKYYCRVELLEEAAKMAFEMKEDESLTYVHSQCGPGNKILADKIVIMKSQLNHR